MHLKKSESSAQNTKNPGTENTQNAGTIGQPVALPPSFKGAQPLKPGQTRTETMPNGLPALKPMMGMNVDTLFSEKIKDTGDRFKRVENAVVDLRKEFEVYKPSIVRLAAVESDIQNLIKELEVLLQETPNQKQASGTAVMDEKERSDPIASPSDATLSIEQLEPEPPEPVEIDDPPPVARPSTNGDNAANASPIRIVPKTAPTASSTKPAQPETQARAPKHPKPLQHHAGIVAQNLRSAAHSNMVRIVLDTNKKTKYSIDLDNNERLIIIELPEARWLSDMTYMFKDSPLLNSYTVEEINDGKGAMLVLSLKKTTTIIHDKRLAPDSSNPHHRIYFDLKL